MNLRCLVRASLVGLLVVGLFGCGDRSLDVASESPRFTQEEIRRAIENHRHRHESWAGTPVYAPPGDSEPVPIPGGLAPGLHVWLPGPTELGLQGLDVDPNTITNFQGFAAIGFFAGTATGSDGEEYDAFHDMRVYNGNYVSADGTHHRGTFAFI